MKKIYTTLVCIAVSLSVWAVQPFTPGNLVMLRSGDGTASLSALTNAAFLDEYHIDAAGVASLVQSIPLPTTPNGLNMALTLVGTKNLEGSMTRSNDGRYLVIPGYNCAPGLETGVTERVAALVDYQGNMDITTSVLATDLKEIRCAASYDGSGIYVSGAYNSAADFLNGLYYVKRGGSKGIPLSDVSKYTYRTVRIVDGQLMANNNTNWFNIGEGMPVTEGAVRSVALNLTQDGYYDICTFNLPEGRVAYVTSTGWKTDGVSGSMGLNKYSYVDGAWVHNGTSQLVGNAHGLTAKQNEDGSITVYFVVSTSSSEDLDGDTSRDWKEERLAVLTDVTGFNNNAYGGTEVKEVVKAPAKTAWRSVAWAPVQTSVLSVPVVAKSEMVVCAEQGVILVSGSDAKQVVVFDLVGNKLCQKSLEKGNCQITGLASNQIYLVKVGAEVRKIRL